MKSVNKVILVGNVGKDPEIKYTPQGTPVAKITLATNESFKDKSGQWQERTEWHNVVAWQRLAEIVGEYLKKGSKVYIEGHLQTRSWDDKQTKQKKYMTEIVANELVLLSDGKGRGSPVTAPKPNAHGVRIAADEKFHDIVLSMKASNVKIMVEAYRLLTARMIELKMDYPIHLGVTEAGDGEDGRIKSAMGIGSLLSDGIGDTIRVSLTEDSPHEIPVAKALIENINNTSNSQLSTFNSQLPFDPFSYQRRATKKIAHDGVKLGGDELIRVVVRQANFDKIAHKIDKMGDYKPEIVYETANIIEVDPRDDSAIARLNAEPNPQFVTVKDDVDLAVIPAFGCWQLDCRRGIRSFSRIADCGLRIGKDFKRGCYLLRQISVHCLRRNRDAILVQGEEARAGALRLSYNILQAAGSRIFKTDYVACPSCGRTLFNLQTTTAKIKAATLHLKGVKIAIMGCIVNGPGEMADADFGYVGGAPGKVNLYVGKTAVKFNIPEAEAVDRLQDLIREHGKWVEPAPADTVLV